MRADPTREDTGESNLVHEGPRGSRVRRWLLLDGDRYVLTGVFSVAVFAATSGIGLVGFLPVTDPATATTLVAAIVGGTLPFITIVLAVNQLVLSQELGWTGQLEERFDAMQSFRHRVEETTGTTVSPAAPADFLQLVVKSVVARVESLRPAAEDCEDPEVAALVVEFVDAVTAEGEVVTDALDDAEFGTFDALSAVLGHFDGAHLFTARTIREHHGDALPEDAEATLDDLIALLGHLAVARQTFKTLYVEHELAHLSKLLLYVGFPTLLGGGLFMMAYAPIIDAVGDTTALVFVVSAVVTLVFLPFVVLLVYTFRIATIASRTADFGPFVPRMDVSD